MGSSGSTPSDPSESDTPTQTPTSTPTPSSTHSRSSTASSFPSGSPAPVTICGYQSYTASTWKTHLSAFQLPYSNLIDCTTTYTAPYKMIVVYQETYRNIEQCCDYIKFFDGVNIFAAELKPSSAMTLTSTGPYLTIHFTTDDTIAYKGVLADVYFIQGPSPSWSPSYSARITQSIQDSATFSDSMSSSGSPSQTNVDAATITSSPSSSEANSFSPSITSKFTYSYSDSSSSSSSHSPHTSQSSAATHTVKSSESIYYSVTNIRSNSGSMSYTPSITHTYSRTPVASKTPATITQTVSVSVSPSAMPTERPRGPPPPLPEDLGNLSITELSGIFQDISYYDPLLIKGALNSLGMAALQQTGGVFSISTPAFDLSMKALPSNISAVVKLPNASLTMPPLSSLGSNLAASMIQWTDNPYSSQSAIQTDTPMLSISVLDANGHEVGVHKSSDPIRFHWPLNASDPRFQQPPSYLANCLANQLYVVDGGLFKVSQASILLSAGAWLVPCIDQWKPLNCSPKDTMISFLCPPPIVIPSCIYWNANLSDWSTEGCSASIQNQTVYCACTHLSDFSSRIQSVVTSNQAVFANAADVYSVNGLQKYAQWYGIFGGIALMTLLLGILAMRIDMITIKKYVMNLCQDPVISPTFNNAPNSAIYIYDPKSTKKCMKQSITRPNKLPLSICQRILQQHSRMQFLFRYDPRLSRLFRLLSLFTIQFHTLFVSALLYGFTYGNAGSEMQWYDILLLSVITSALNIPVIRLLLTSLNTVGMKEYEYMFPLLCEEYMRRSEFEVLAIEYLTRKDVNSNETGNELEQRNSTSSILDTNNMNMIQNSSSDTDDSIINLIFVYLCCRSEKQEEENPLTKLTSKQLLVRMIKIMKRKYMGVEVFNSSWEILPCHTLHGFFFLACCIGWFAWCLNYLLLFAASHSPSVGQQILISYASSELSTIFISQPLTILITYLLFKAIHRYEAYIPQFFRKYILINNKNNIPHLYFFSNPWMDHAKSVFTSKFAYSLFIRCPALASNTNELAYAPLKAILYDHDVETDGYDVEGLYSQIRNIGKELTLRSTERT